MERILLFMMLAFLLALPWPALPAEDGGGTPEADGKAESKDATDAKAPEQEAVDAKSDSADFLKGLSEEEALKELNNAIRKGNIERVKAILAFYPKHLEKKDSFGGTPLFNAVDAGKKEIVELLIARKASLACTNVYGDTALHRAAESGYPEIAALLITSGIPVWSKNKKGESAIFKAVSTGQDDVVLLLLEKGELVNCTDSANNTPLHKAAQRGKMDMVKLLIEKGAKVQAKNKKGQKPADVAANDEVKQFLIRKDPEAPKEEDAKKEGEDE